MKTIKLFSRIFPLILGLLVAACNNDGTLGVSVDSVVIEPPILTIAVGEQYALTAIVCPQDSTNKNVSWSTDSSSAVSVSAEGVVEGLAEGEGFVMVTTEDGGKIAVCGITVEKPFITVTPGVSAVAFSASGNTLYAGDEKIDPTFSVALAREVAWNVEVIGAGWCTVEKDIQGKTFTLKADANTSETTAPDDVTVRVTAEDKSVEITVSQKAVTYDVYVAGTVNYEPFTSTAAYWKNGEKIELGVQGEHSFTKQIIVYEGDIYISGNIENTPGYWKNGEFHSFPANSNAELYDIQISGGDIYATGYDGYKAVYWKNDQLIRLETVTSYGYGLYVDGTDVYVVGAKPGTGPMIWKNGIGEVFSDSGASISAIHIENGNVYIGGEKNDCVHYWINGTPYASETEFESYMGFYNGMTVHNGKVYIAGEDLIDYDWYTFYATYWVDGEFFTLKGNPAYPSSANSVRFFGDDMYVAGKEKDYNIVNHAAYWKNGVITILDAQTYDTEASDILLVQTE